jgi:hypothetical protein
MNSRALRCMMPTVALLLVMFMTVIALPMALAQAPGTPQGGPLRQVEPIPGQIPEMTAPGIGDYSACSAWSDWRALCAETELAR